MIPHLNTASVRILTQSLADIFPSPGQIGIYHPHDKGEAELALYSIRKCSDMNAKIGRNAQELPPRFVTLNYLITAHSKLMN